MPAATPPAQVAARAGFVVLGLATAAVSACYGAIFALLADLQDHYGVPTYGLGLIAGSTFLASFTAQVGLARYADRGHTVTLARAGLAAAAVGMVLFGLASELWQFVAARTVVGLGVGSFLPSVRRLVVSQAPERAGALLGRLGAFDIGGFVAGPVVAAGVAAVGGLRAPFLVLGVALAACSPVLARVREPERRPPPERGVVRLLLRRRPVRAALCVAAAFYLAIGTFDAIWARYMKDLGASRAVIAASLSLLGVPMMFAAPRAGRLVDRVGARRATAVSIVLTAPVLASYGFVQLVPYLVIGATLQSIVDAVTMVGGQAGIADAAGRELMATGQGLYGATGTSVAALAAIGAAPLYDTAGPEVLWALCGAGALTLAGLKRVWSRPAAGPG